MPCTGDCKNSGTWRNNEGMPRLYLAEQKVFSRLFAGGSFHEGLDFSNRQVGQKHIIGLGLMRLKDNIRPRKG